MGSYGVIRNLRIKGRIIRKLRIQSILEIKLLDSAGWRVYIACIANRYSRAGSE